MRIKRDPHRCSDRSQAQLNPNACRKRVLKANLQGQSAPIHGQRNSMASVPQPVTATKKTPLLVQPGQGDGDPHLGITHQARQRHIWCIAAEIDDQVCLNTYFACLIPTLP